MIDGERKKQMASGEKDKAEKKVESTLTKRRWDNLQNCSRFQQKMSPWGHGLFCVQADWNT